jgi:hypothetical protein
MLDISSKVPKERAVSTQARIVVYKKSVGQGFGSATEISTLTANPPKSIAHFMLITES